MRFVLSILILSASIACFGTNYYVSPKTGNDNDSGLDTTNAWATWQKAFGYNLSGGDTVFFMDGIWYPTTEAYGNVVSANGLTGTHANWIVFTNYPGATPILDCINVNHSAMTTVAVNIFNCTYVEFNGLTIRNRRQSLNAEWIAGVMVASSDGDDDSVLKFERMVSTGHSGTGFFITSYDTLYVINCDSHNNCDSLGYDGGDDGGRADGFNFSSRGTDADTFKYTYVTGCRSWNNSDDAFDIGTTKQFLFFNNWSFNGGRLNGEGNGIKLSYSNVYNPSKRVVRNNLCANMKGTGFCDLNLNHATDGPFSSYYNNTAYKCRSGFTSAPSVWQCAEGDTGYVIFKNNVVYQSTGAAWEKQVSLYACFYNYPAYSLQTHNTWQNNPSASPWWIINTDYSVTDDDFISLDSAELFLPRQADGSLPYINYLKLAGTSDLVNTGTYVGIPYAGIAPDLGYAEFNPIIADHTIVDNYTDIPQQWIDSVKTMWLSYAGESHSAGIRGGLLALEAIDPKFSVAVKESGTPDAYTTTNLRASRGTWGDLNNSTGWIYNYGEEDWFTSAAAISRTKDGITYCNAIENPITVFGFGWCWDVGLSATNYVNATKQYIEYCSDSIPTTVIFTTGPVDTHVDAAGYSQYLKYSEIRDSVNANPSRILFDYADILCYDDGSETPNTTTYDGHTYPIITSNNVAPEAYYSHISEDGALRLAKAMWWMLARIAGWDGLSSDTVPDQPSTSTDILTFTLSSQVSSATINSTAHTVSIQVAYGTNVTSLTPAITVSAGATISPTSGTARNFTTPLSYTVTAEDGTTTQTWTVTVTVADAPPVTPSGTKRLRMRYAGDSTIYQGTQRRIKI